MSFSDGRMYTVRLLPRTHAYWQEIQDAVTRRTKSGHGPLTLDELYDVRWRDKPFPWSYSHEFKPNRRWFFHGTSAAVISQILDGGFQITQGTSQHGRMLGDGVYATYHTNKGKMYGADGYVISVMVYAPNTYLVNPGQSIDQATIDYAGRHYDAVEVRTGALVRGYPMRNHEICVYDTHRIIPRFILKIV